MGKVASDKSAVVAAIPAACANEQTAVEFFEQSRGWDTTPGCPRCGDTNVYAMKNRDGSRQKDFRWRCRGCKQQYTVRTGTVYEDSKIALRHWCHAFWRACSSKKGVSALQIKRETGLSYKSALFLMHRIRWAMAELPDGPLKGIVEVDETYVGGKFRKRQAIARPKHEARRLGRAPDFPDRKTPVFAMVERGGRVRAQVPRYVSAKNVRRIMEMNIDPSAHLMTDELKLYRKIGQGFSQHDTVNHGRGEYARGDATTNTIEGFFSLLKRGLVGTFHDVSRTHLHRYVSEFQFRYNQRHVEDGQRTVTAIRAAEGKRLFTRYG